MTRIEGATYPDPDTRRSTPASRRFSDVLRGQKDERDKQTEARVRPKIAKVLGERAPESEPEDIAALRRQAQEAREQAATARRRADEARRRAK
jgi:hypothetical protein